MLKTRPKNRALALLLVVLMIFSQTAMTASAEDGNMGNVITAFDALAAEVAAQAVSAGTAEHSLTLPETLNAVIDGEAGAVSGVTWTSAPGYDGSTPGTYTFTAETPDPHIVTDGVELPDITVTVEPVVEDGSITDNTEANIPGNTAGDTEDRLADDDAATPRAVVGIMPTSVSGVTVIGTEVRITGLTTGSLETTVQDIVADSDYSAISAPNAITKLTIIGSMNGDDLDYIWKGRSLSSSSSGTLDGLTALDLAGVTLSDGMTAFPNYQFAYFRNLQSIALPDGLTSMGNYTFYSCTGLKSIDLPDGLTSIGNDTFEYCTGLKNIDLPDGLTSIGNSIFYGCTGLKSIDLPDGLTSIGGYAFYGCTGLKSIDLPDGLTSIGNSTFYGCTGLTSIDLPGGLTSIGNYAFANCGNLSNINLSNCTSLTSIGSYTFYSCTGLKSIDSLPDGLTSIGYYTFAYCRNLSNIDLSNCTSLTSIGGRTFQNCTSLTDVDLSDVFQVVGISDTFYNTSGVVVSVPPVLLSDYKADSNWNSSVNNYSVQLTGVDVTPPTGEIKVETKNFASFLNTITFGLFFKDTAEVAITGEDPGSGVDTIEYIKTDTAMTQAALASATSWTVYNSSFSVNANEKCVIYAKITDKSNNSTIISSDGVVVYTDSAVTVNGGSFSKASDDDLTVTVAMNGNTVKSITNGSYTLIAGTDYTTGVDTITFKNGYLKNLADGTYNFTVSWYPLGETGTLLANSDTPGTTTVTISVSKSNQNTLSITGLGSSHTYGDSSFELATSGGSGTGAVTFTSSNPPVASVSGNTVAIHKAGSFTITAKKAADAEYNEASVDSGIVTVSEVTPAVTLTGNNVSYGNNVTLGVTVSGAGATPAGTVTFKEGTTVLDTVTLVNGEANCTVTLPTTGNHSYTAEYSGQTGYYTAAAGTASVGVGMTDQVALSITDKPNMVTYGDSIFNLSTSGGSSTGAITFSVPNNDVISITSGGVVTINNAGTVTVTAVKAGDNNYNAATATLEITVSPRDIDNITVTVTGSTVYTGSKLQPTFTVADGTLAIDTGDYTNTYGANVTVAEGGTIILTGQRNYTGTKTVNFTILKETPQAVIFPTADAVTYDPGQTLADVTLSGGSGDGTFTWQDDTIVPTANNSGYTVVFTPNDTDNYDYTGIVLTKTAALTVNKAEQSLAGLQDLVKTNGGANFIVTPVSNASAEDPDISFRSSDTSVIEVDASGSLIIKGDGTAIITVSAAETDNYTVAEANFKITVLADTASLDDVIDAAEDLIDSLNADDIGNGNGQYPPDAVDALQDAIDAAKDVANDSSATQTAVNQAKEDLLKAIEDFQNSLVAVDYTALDKAITDAVALEKGYYTDATWSAMQTALANGKAVRSTAHVTQAEVDSAAKALNAAIAALTNEYKFTTAFGTFTGTGNLTGKIDVPCAKFVKLLIDGKEVNSTNYTVTEGSTVITLKEAYLKTLANGKYTVKAEFTDGVATTTLTVNVSSTTSDGSAKTGDDIILWPWLALLSVSGLGIAGITLTRKRKLFARKGK